MLELEQCAVVAGRAISRDFLEDFTLYAYVYR